MAAPRKSPQILSLEPPEALVFEGPFDRVVTSYLELKNPSEQRVCFKVKTTAPHRYGVRPNSGLILPGGKIKIAIMFHPTEKDSQAERAKHKFMVQSLVLGEKITPSDAIWREAKAEEVMDSKLRCIFRHADSGLESRDVPSAPVSMQQPASKVTSSSSDGDTSSYNKNQAQQQQPPTLPLASAHSEDSSPAKARASPNEQTISSSPRNIRKRDDADKSIASSQNLTSSFLQPMSDDYKMVLVSLAMLIVGVILGKYII